MGSFLRAGGALFLLVPSLHIMDWQLQALS